MKPMLSSAQLALLRYISQKPEHAVDYYPPAKKLVELGLAEFKGNRLYITEAGKQRLEIPASPPRVTVSKLTRQTLRSAYGSHRNGPRT